MGERRRGGQYHLDAAQQAALRADWLAGVKGPTLCARYGICAMTLGNYRRLLNLPSRARGRARTTPIAYRPRAPKPQPVDFPFKWFPPRIVRGKRWRCPCGNQSDRGPQCIRCRQEAA